MASIAHNLRLQGFKASRAVRGTPLTLNRTGTIYSAIVNTSDGPVDYYGDGNVQIRSEIHILRSDLGEVLPGAGDYFTDAEQGIKHVLTDPPNWQTDPLVVRIMCRVEPL